MLMKINDDGYSWDPMYILLTCAEPILRYDVYNARKCKETEEKETESRKISMQSLSIRVSRARKPRNFLPSRGRLCVEKSSIRIDGIESVVFVEIDCIAISTREQDCSVVTSNLPCGFTNQLMTNANPKVAVRQTKTVCVKLPTVAA